MGPAAIVAAVAAVVAAIVGLRKVFLNPVPAGVDIVRDVDDDTVINQETGAVRAVQSAEVMFPAQAIDALWSPLYLERLARTYWRFLTRATLGIVRVYYTPGERYVCLLFRPFKLITFDAPEYEMNAERGVVRWRIDTGDELLRWECELGQGECAVTKGTTAAEPRATLTLPPVEFVKLTSGNAAPAKLLMTGRLKVSGDLGFAAALPKLFDIPKP